MIELILLPIIAFLLLVVWFFLFPLKLVGKVRSSEDVLNPPDFYVYSYVIHIHSQFSYDSLGKPEDIIRAREKQRIDYVIVTDHNNEHIGKFADERLIAGREIKLNDEEGNLLGDLLEIGNLKVIAHNFREKYRWRVDKDPDYILELVNLRDALLRKKTRLTLFILASTFLYPFFGERIVRNFAKLIDTEFYVKAYFNEGWRSKILGGLDHHVKLYIREVRKRMLVPSYELSFLLMRNFLLVREAIGSKEDIPEAIKRGINIISFSEKPTFVWIEEKTIMASTPFKNTYMVVLSEKGKTVEALGSNLKISELDRGRYIILGYTYAFKIGKLLFGIRPLFVSDLLEVA